MLFQRWGDYASLAYPATAMRCLAAWAVGGLTLAAGLLPDPDSAVASVAVASNLYVSIVSSCLMCFRVRSQRKVLVVLKSGLPCADGALHALRCNRHCRLRQVACSQSKLCFLYAVDKLPAVLFRSMIEHDTVAFAKFLIVAKM